MSGNRSAWITPCGRPCGQSRSSDGQLASRSGRADCAAPRRRGRGSARTAAASRRPRARCGAAAKSSPARCSFASASPSAAQCTALGRRIHMPSRKVTIAAGRPATLPSSVARPVLDRLRTGDPAARQVLHQAEEERQVLGRDPLLVERQDVVAASRCGPGSSSSRPPRRCPCRTTARRDRSRRGNRPVPPP